MFPWFKGRLKYKPGQARAFGMLAGGSGITPMFQVCMSIWTSKVPFFFFFLKLFLSAEFMVSVWLFSVLILLQLIRAILENPKDKTNVHLIYANVTRNDILLKVRYYIYLPFIPHSYCAQPLYFNLILDWIRLQPRLVKSWIMVKATSSIP